MKSFPFIFRLSVVSMLMVLAMGYALFTVEVRAGNQSLSQTCTIQSTQTNWVAGQPNSDGSTPSCIIDKYNQDNGLLQSIQITIQSQVMHQVRAENTLPEPAILEADWNTRIGFANSALRTEVSVNSPFAVTEMLAQADGMIDFIGGSGREFPVTTYQVQNAIMIYDSADMNLFVRSDDSQMYALPIQAITQSQIFPPEGVVVEQTFEASAEVTITYNYTVQDLAVDISHLEPIQANSKVRFAISITNKDTQTYRENGSVWLTIPSVVGFVSALQSEAVDYDQQSGLIQFEIPSPLAPGETRTLEFYLQIPDEEGAELPLSLSILTNVPDQNIENNLITKNYRINVKPRVRNIRLATPLQHTENIQIPASIFQGFDEDGVITEYRITDIQNPEAGQIVWPHTNGTLGQLSENQFLPFQATSVLIFRPTEGYVGPVQLTYVAVDNANTLSDPGIVAFEVAESGAESFSIEDIVEIELPRTGASDFEPLTRTGGSGSSPFIITIIASFATFFVIDSLYGYHISE